MELWLYDQSTNTRQTLRVDSDPIVIGRDEGCGVVLKSPFVARKHARIVRKGNQLFVESIGRSATRVANRDVTPEQPVRLDFGDEIQIAQFSIAFIRPGGKEKGETGVNRRELQARLMTFEQQVNSELLERLNLRVTGHLNKNDAGYVGQILKHL